MMIKRCVVVALATVAVASGLLAGAPVASASLCGYTGEDDGYSNKANYNNCTQNVERVRIDYTYANELKCMSPGDNALFANPALGAVRNAVSLGVCDDPNGDPYGPMDPIVPK